MILRIKKYEQLHIPLVKEFNSRLKSQNLSDKFPEFNIPKWLPKENDTELFQEYYLAFLNDAVRGGYILKYQKFLINQKILSIADYQLPLSEGIIDTKYSFIGINLTLDALKRSPMLYAMGMGGYSEKLPRLLKMMKWKLFKIPFHFIIFNPHNFLLNITFLRRNKFFKTCLNILAFSKLGGLIIRLIFYFRKQNKKFPGLEIHKFEWFDDKFDNLWQKVKNKYKFIAVRDSRNLNILYKDNKFKKFTVNEDKKIIGWFIVLNTKMKNHKQFGSMRVGSIIDSFSSPENAIKIISYASEYLKKCDVDIVISNHSHISWNKAFKEIGYLQGPSNYLFAASQELCKQIEPFKENSNQFFFMRGDGDGPINL